MEKEENISDQNCVEKVEINNESAKIQEEIINQQQAQQFITNLIEENERLLIEINNLSKYRNNKNIITPQMSLLTNKLQRNLIKIARLVPPEALADPSHVKDQKERFLKFYRGRNAPKKNGPSQQGVNGIGSTPTKNIKQTSK